MTDSTHHVVVLDCNIILTLASHFDGSFTPSEVKALVARSAVRATSQPILNAARAFMLATRGETFTGQPISFVTSRHILNTVIHKATQPSQGPTQEQQGLGLHRRVAEDLSDFSRTFQWTLSEVLSNHTNRSQRIRRPWIMKMEWCTAYVGSCPVWTAGFMCGV